jgi:membrane protein implicated in regulation of membrane protease activity
VAKREHFLTFSWAHLAGIIFFAAGAWLSEGPLFVVVVGVIALTVIGVYYAIWRWLQNRSTDPSRPR